MTDDDLIADFISRHGVTVCPPGAFSPGYFEGDGHWTEQRATAFAIRERKLRFEAAAAKRAAAEAKAARHDPLEARRADVLRLAMAETSPAGIAEALGVPAHVVSHDLRVLRARGEAIPSLRAAGNRRGWAERVGEKSCTGDAQ